jgi:hypothetical protein
MTAGANDAIYHLFVIKSVSGNAINESLQRSLQLAQSSIHDRLADEDWSESFQNRPSAQPSQLKKLKETTES